MTEFTIEEDCGNSPRKTLLKEFYAAFAASDIDEMLSPMTDDVRLIVVGDETVDGKRAVADRLKNLAEESPTAMTVENVITHGYTAAANGEVTFDGEETHAFCTVFTFDGATKTAKIETVESYVIETT